MMIYKMAWLFGTGIVRAEDSQFSMWKENANVMWSAEDERNMQKLLSLTDDATTEWVQKKTREMMTLMVCYKCAMMEVETKFNVLNEEFALKYDRNPISTIKTRLKTPMSIRDKMQLKGLAISPNMIEETLNDIAGVRVICAFPDDVYTLSEAFLKQDDIVLFEKKDYIANPKENGYRSLHLIVGIPIFLETEKKIMKVEIQLRTIAMDFWATLEHQLRYKKDVCFTPEMAKELYECAQQSSLLDLRMDALRQSVMERRVEQREGCAEDEKVVSKTQRESGTVVQ